MLGSIAGCTQPASSSTLRGMRALRPAVRARGRAAGTLSCSAEGSSGRSAWPSFIAGPNSGEVSPSFKAIAQRALGAPRRGTRSSTMRAADLDQPAVLHARRAGRLAGAAGEAAVEVELRSRGRRRALEHLLHQVDAAARPVELVAEQLVGRAGRGAEAAVHALAQDRLGLAPVGVCL